jgi:hypothetical protein
MRSMATRAAAIVIVFFTMAMNCLAQSNERMTYSVIAIEYIGESDSLVESVHISPAAYGTSALAAAQHSARSPPSSELSSVRVQP